MLVLFQYMNQKSIFESQEQHITSLQDKMTQTNDSIEKLNDRVAEAQLFYLDGER